jgi:hypothetical protein
MAAKKNAAKAGAAAIAAGKNPYVQRLMDDEELRQNLWQAYQSARSAASRLSNGKSPAKAVFDDKKLQKDVREAAFSVRDAGLALREAPKRSTPKKKRRGGGLVRLLALGLVGGGAAVALSEGLRNKVLDALFGAEEEFEYTSTTSPPSGGDATSTQPAGSTS